MIFLFMCLHKSRQARLGECCSATSLINAQSEPKEDIFIIERLRRTYALSIVTAKTPINVRVAARAACNLPAVSRKPRIASCGKAVHADGGGIQKLCQEGNLMNSAMWTLATLMMLMMDARLARAASRVARRTYKNSAVNVLE